MVFRGIPRAAMNGVLMKLLAAILCCLSMVLSETDPGDLKILIDFWKGMKNRELLKWPVLSETSDPCGPPSLPHLFCSQSKVTQIQVQNLGLEGPLPSNFNSFSKLTNLGFQHNKFSGPLPNFSKLSDLQYLYLGYNQFDTILPDGLSRLPSLQVLSLDYNPLNKTGWKLSDLILDSPQLMNLSLMGCNIVGGIPDSLGSLGSLKTLELSYNSLRGGIPGTLSGSPIEVLWLNNQEGEKLSGTIDIIGSMVSLKQVWLHGNALTGAMPETIGNCSVLSELLLNGNQFVGPLPLSLSALPLQKLQLDDNMFTGPLPKLPINYSYSGNSFCQQRPGLSCAAEVTALLDFLSGLKYPANLALSWGGNDPCIDWKGIACRNGKVSVINLPNFNLSGTLSPSVGKLESLQSIWLQGNNLSGQIPESWVGLKFLQMLNLSGNKFDPPFPNFRRGVKLVIDGNPSLDKSPPRSVPSPMPISPSKSPPESSLPPSERPQSPPFGHPPGRNTNYSGSPSTLSPVRVFKESKFPSIAVVIACVAAFALVVCAMGLVWLKRRRTSQHPGSFVVYRKESSDPDNMLKIVVANNNNRSSSNVAASRSQSISSNSTNEKHMLEAGNLIISVQVLRGVTRNFAVENELGRGGFGVVYKGEFVDGTTIAVKRMESSAICNKALDEFQSEIAVLSKVRHRHLVTLLGYSIEGNERLLVYEYMPQGALSKHLFQWKSLKLEPLSWKKRLTIALGVARGMEYLHSLAHQSFIHRDLKSSNILLGDDFNAKVSDFGLVKSAPDGKHSVATRLAGTFGYLAPEYAVTGKITTKADVFSYGVVLMEMVTGLKALDEERSEESRYLAEWFWQIKSSKEKLIPCIDPAIDLTEETLESIIAIAELAGHCTARDPSQRPDMGHTVNVLAPMVEKWSPRCTGEEEFLGIDCSQPLHQMVKGWQAADGAGYSMASLDDSKGSIPARPTGFAESFTSADGR